MNYSIKDYQELLELNNKQGEVILKQSEIIESLTYKKLELENFIAATGHKESNRHKRD